MVSFTGLFLPITLAVSSQYKGAEYPPNPEFVPLGPKVVCSPQLAQTPVIWKRIF